MDNIKSLVILPHDLEEKPQIGGALDEIEVLEPSNESPQVRKNRLQSLINILKITYTLANADGINENLGIKTSDGTFDSNVNLAQLLTLTQKPVRIPKGISNLIDLMREVKVDINLIRNEAIKSKLLDLPQIPTSLPKVRKKKKLPAEFFINEKPSPQQKRQLDESPTAPTPSSPSDKRLKPLEFNQEILDKVEDELKDDKDKEWDIPHDDSE